MNLVRDNAWELLTEYTESESLLKHALAVEAAVRGYARRFGEDENDWGVVALLHDFDYERWPSPADHPFRGCEIPASVTHCLRRVMQWVRFPPKSRRLEGGGRDVPRRQATAAQRGRSAALRQVLLKIRRAMAGA